MTESKPTFSDAPPSKLAKAAVVSARIHLSSIRLIETAAHSDIRDGEFPTQMTVDVGTTTSHDEASHAVKVFVRLGVSGRYGDDTSVELVKPPLQINATYLVEYKLDYADGLTPENFDAFGELNGMHNCWPYCREYVQSIVGRMGLPPMVLPVFRPITMKSPGHTKSGIPAK
ncbi:MAG: hypothetical protein JW809_04755 [Pirellulales bacterium]|nr:hypothetical protein [Pirellulales bacterium]